MKVSENRSTEHARGLSLKTVLAALLLVAFAQLLAAQTTGEWQRQVRNDIDGHHIDAALAIVDRRLAESPEDWEAHGWRGRLLARKGLWSEGEAEYRLVLDKVPKVDLVLSDQESSASAQRYLRNPHSRYQPRYDHPFFQQAFKELVGLLAAEFDGNPLIEFIDTFMYGFWGEGHTWPFANNPFPD